MECPFCKEQLDIKEHKSKGVYARCAFCKFSGYVPIRTSDEDDEVVRTSDEDDEVVRTSDDEVVRTSDEDDEVVRTSDENIYSCKGCRRKFKTLEGFKRHLLRVVDEKDIHPIIFSRHDKAYD